MRYIAHLYGVMVRPLRVVDRISKRSASGTEPDLSAALVAQIAAGDKAAMERLYDATSSVVFGLVLRIVRDYPAAEDVTIAVYSQVWMRASSYNPERGSVLGWLFAIARNRAIDHLRQRRRDPASEPIEAASELAAVDRGPEDEAEVSRERQAVRQALASLPREQRVLIELAYFGGLSHGQIAARSTLPLGTVKTRIRAAMLELRAKLAMLRASGDPMGVTT